MVIGPEDRVMNVYMEKGENKTFYLEIVESDQKSLLGFNKVKHLQSAKSLLRCSGFILNELHQDSVDLSRFDEYFDMDHNEDIAKFRVRYIGM